MTRRRKRAKRLAANLGGDKGPTGLDHLEGETVKILGDDALDALEVIKDLTEEEVIVMPVHGSKKPKAVKATKKSVGKKKPAKKGK